MQSSIIDHLFLVIPTNVALLAHKHPALRRAALKNLSAALQAMDLQASGPIKSILQLIMDGKEEIAADHSHVQR